MAVKSITMVSETNGYDGSQWDWEAPQGSTFPFVRIYKIENTDGPDQYFKFEVTLDSYGNIGGNYSSVEDSLPKTFTEVTPETKTVTVFA